MKQSRAGFPRFIWFLFLFGIMGFPFPQQASADGIHGLLEYIYENSHIKLVDTLGVTSNIKSEGLSQRYILAFDRTLFPSLVFSGGGLFETAFQNGTTDGVDSKSDRSRLSPYVDLVLKNPFISSGIGFRRREDTSSNNGSESTKLIQDMYSANLGWHPSDLPSLDLFYTRRYLYDAKRTTQDIQTDNFTWSSAYRSIKGLELDYNGSYNTVQDNLRDTQIESLNNSGRIAYSGTLLDNRVLYHSSYNISIQDSSITSGKAGPLLTQQPALNQLFATTDPNALAPPNVTNGRLTVVPNLKGQNINLVLPLPIPNPQQSNIGLQFFANTTEVSTLFLSVTSKGVSPPKSSLDKIGDQFSSIRWDIYTSNDGEIWRKLQTGFNVVVDTNPNPLNPGSDDVGFKFTFQPLNTQYIKIVEIPFTLDNTPLLASGDTNIDPKSILVSSLQAFKTIQVKTPGKPINSSTIGGIYDMNVKALLLDNPNLSYDMTFTFTHNKSDQSPLTTTYLLNNGLGVSRRLGEIWSVNGRLTEEFSADAQSKIRNVVSYNAGLTATPLPTLNHSLVFGGRVEFFEGKTTLTNSIYLNNSAELYKGLSVNLGAGYSTGTQASGQSSDSVSFTVGTEIVPNKNFTLSLSLQSNDAHQSGGGQPNQTSFDRTATATATYRPYEAIYLTAGYSIFMQNNRGNVTLNNYGMSWSPFRGGDLQFNFAFNESYNSGDNEKDQNISPSLRWNIRPGSTLDVSYSIQNSKSGTTGSVDTKSLGAQLRITF